MNKSKLLIDKDWSVADKCKMKQ